MLDQERLDVGHTIGPVFGDAGRNLDGPVEQFSGRHQVVQQADVVGLVGEDFTPAVEQFLGLGPAHHGRQAPGGVQLSIVDRQEPEAAFLAAQEKVQAGGHDRATAIAKAVDGADDRFGGCSQMPGVFGAGGRSGSALLV